MSDGTSTEPVGPDGRTYEQYLDERKLLIDGERAAGEGFDKTFLTLCAGAIALSVTFVEKVGSAGKFKPLLYLSWAFLACGLLLNVRCFLLLQNSYNRLLDMNDEIYEKGRTALQNPFRSRVGDFNQYAFWSFVAGIVLLLFFAGRKLPIILARGVGPRKGRDPSGRQQGHHHKDFRGQHAEDRSRSERREAAAGNPEHPLWKSIGNRYAGVDWKLDLAGQEVVPKVPTIRPVVPERPTYSPTAPLES
jgi:hypothetical protein